MWQEVQAGRDVAVVTPTASGKTLCYNLPVLDAILKQGDSRALYIFPTKALANDQLDELHGLITAMGADIKTYTYDGDTPTAARTAIRSAGHIVVTNPDMLHSGILPNHTKWNKLFGNLKYIVIDELHTYRGIFGSAFANVLKRLLRVCAFYGSHPQFIVCSATIHNPGELAEKLIGRPVAVIDENGAGRAARTLILYNPPVINAELNIRQGAITAATRISSLLLSQGVKTISFARSRQSMELMLTYLQAKLPAGAVAGYRGGYLPNERRSIENALRDGKLRGVVSTNALELGIDIGELEACVMAGYPGSLSSMWQQVGRSGRRSGHSLAVLVAGTGPLDQYLMTHPDYLISSPAENGRINPDNYYIALAHLECAAFELPFREEQTNSNEEALLRVLTEQGSLRHIQGRFFWMGEKFPAHEISLRSGDVDNFVIIDTTPPRRVIGYMDRVGAMTMLHDEAIYYHMGQQYHVDKLDFAEKKAYVTPVDVDYYTDANLAVNLDVLRLNEERGLGCGRLAQVDVTVNALATIFKKIKLETHENIGFGRINLPQYEMQTSAFMLSVPRNGELPNSVWETGLLGLSYVLQQLAPLYLLCDQHDLGVMCQTQAPFTGEPTIYIYDAFPGGTGLAQKLYQVAPELLAQARDQIASCGCAHGCPSCVGAEAGLDQNAKAVALALCDHILTNVVA